METKVMRRPTSKEEIQLAIDFYGGYTALACKLGVSESAIRHWLRQGFCPIEAALVIHRATKGEINVHRLIGIPKWAQ